MNKRTGALAYFDSAGDLLMREPERGGRSLTPKSVTRNVFCEGAIIVTDQSIDGARATVEEHEVVFDRDAFEVKIDFVFAEDEALFGLRSHEEGYGKSAWPFEGPVSAEHEGSGAAPGLDARVQRAT